MKRSYSESSDNDDVFDDDRIKAGSPSQSCSVTDRKKRRGIIEKRRRDRINNSLTELRRLVPSAFEKQVCTRDNSNGSAKLEKAEILQMTVDHLKLLHQKGMNSNYYDPHSLAMDYRTVGYRECAAEVARYLVTVEGLDIQDPLRMRLMSHLQCYSAQREIASKTCHQNTTWNPPQTQYTTPTTNAMISQHNQNTDQMTTLSPLTSCADTRNTHPQDNTMSMAHVRIPTTVQQVNVASSAPQISHSQALLPTIPQVHTQFPVSLMNSMGPGVLSPSGIHNYSPPSSIQSSLKPYRPWGSELVY